MNGVRCWPSRDPIEEGGGFNLYGFIRNDGVNQWDYLGQSFASTACRLACLAAEVACEAACALGPRLAPPPANPVFTIPWDKICADECGAFCRKAGLKCDDACP